MNVNDYLVSYTKVPEFNEQNVISILETRVNTCNGFLKVEGANGGWGGGYLASKGGQEQARLFLMRGIEEIMESLESSSDIHRQEELIDAFNFFFGILSFQDLTGSIPTLADRIVNGVSPYGWYYGIDFNVVIRCLSPFLEKLRNRVWQNGVQSPFFEGTPQALHMLIALWSIIVKNVGGWEEFFPMFYAKDDVLQFRLRSNY